MSSSLPDGVTVRPALDEDAPAAAGVYHAAEAAVRGLSLYDADDKRRWWRLVDLPTGTWLLHEGPELVAAGTLVVRGDAAEFDGAVQPEHVGRGLGSALLDLGEDRARTTGLRVFRVRTYAEDDRAIALVTSRGHRDVRHFLTMRIDLDETPEPPTWPRGIVVDTFEPEDERAFHSALGEAFAQEWGVVQTEFDEWRRLRLEDPDFDPTLWFVARDGGELAAGARCELLFDGGWIAAIGVRPAWRRRGIGRALLLHAFAEFRRRGKTVVRLGVDAENPTGAAHLYEGAGMTVEFEDVVYEKELSRSG